MNPGTGVYVHIPFCLRKCAYCDYNSYPIDEALVEPYLETLLEEAECRRSEGPCVTAYFGGGTPTCIETGRLTALVKEVLALFRVGPDAEVSMEANPGTLDRSKANALRDAGVNRISLGFQSLDDQVLLRIGRIHTSREARDAFALAREAGFPSINVDVMYGLPGQTRASLERTIREVAALGPKHISVYPLQLEEGTPLFGEVHNGRLSLPPEEEEMAMYHTVLGVLGSSGYERYEISNFSLPGHACRHNMIYWKGAGYIGLGAGAHSYRGSRRWWNVSDLVSYTGGKGEGGWVGGEEELTVEERRFERIILALRTSEGLDLSAFREEFGVDLEDAYPCTVARLQAEGLVLCQGGRLSLTGKGLPVANRVFLEFSG